jgi:hypothetical protein
MSREQVLRVVLFVVPRLISLFINTKSTIRSDVDRSYFYLLYVKLDATTEIRYFGIFSLTRLATGIKGSEVSELIMIL